MMGKKSKAELVFESLISNPVLGPNFVKVTVIRGRAGRYEDFPDWVRKELKDALKRKGIERLYSHQRKAIDLIRSGRNVCLVTPTASGKTLAYNLPIINDLIENPSVRALYLFPTKALSQDQLKEFLDVSDVAADNIRIHTYDGDTPADARRAVRLGAHVVITNPDMLHTGILPHHTKWNQFFANLKYVVIDELHVYRGVFGSHIANLMRRLKRVCKFYGVSPLFICCSATVANPKEHAENLLEEDVELVDESGAPTADKIFAFYNPPVVNRAMGIRANFLNETKRLAEEFVKNGVSTIVFSTSRLNVEVLTRYLKEQFDVSKTPDAPSIVSGYRGGYLPELRREIERGLKDGMIKCVVSTNALELGIDIGQLEACIISGYPGTIASTWQQAGRAGRRRDTSVAIFVARSYPLDQYIVTHPEYFFESSPEHCLINPDNLAILLSHVQAASFELPFKSDEKFGRANISEILEVLQEKGILHKSDDKYHWMQDSYPADSISLRSVTAENFVVLDTSTNPPTAIGEVDYRSAFIYLYEGAIYMVESDTYHIDKLDIESQRALASPVEVDYFTDAITHVLIKILDVFDSRMLEDSLLEHGDVLVREKVAGFKKIRFYTNENLGYGDVNLPDQEFHTSGCWLTLFNRSLFELGFSVTEIVEGLLGLSNLLRYSASLCLMCDPRDIDQSIGDKQGRWLVDTTGRKRGVALAEALLAGRDELAQEMTFDPTVFLVDHHPGGVGLAPQIFEKFEEIAFRALEIVQGCFCPFGCPSCVGPVTEVGHSAKRVAEKILVELILGHERKA